MEKKSLKIQETDRGFKYVAIRYDAHDYKELKVWVNNRIYITPTEEEDKYILEFPIQKAQIIKTQKGSFVLKPGKGNVFYHSISSGYRGSSNLEPEKDCEMLEKVWNFASGRGALGDSCHAFFNSQKANCEVRWHRSGRRVEQTDGVVRLTIDGNVEEIIDDPEVCDLLE